MILVTGAPRSGTSMVAEMCEYMGIAMHSSNNKDKWNPRGYWEDEEFTRINEEILHDARGKTFEPPPLYRIWEIDASQPIRDLVAKRNGEHKLWGFKDPRLCFTLGHYLPYQPKVIVTERSEAANVKSLMQYQNMTEREAKLFLHYALSALYLIVPDYLKVKYEYTLEHPQEVAARIAEYAGTSAADASAWCVDKRLNRNG